MSCFEGVVASVEVVQEDAVHYRHLAFALVRLFVGISVSIKTFPFPQVEHILQPEALVRHFCNDAINLTPV